MIETNKEYKVAPPSKLWDAATMKSATITISAAAKAYPAGTILSATVTETENVKKTTFTAVTSALTGTCYILADDVAKGATSARVIVSGTAFLDAVNAVNATSFTMTDVMAATWAGNVSILDRKEVSYAN